MRYYLFIKHESGNITAHGEFESKISLEEFLKANSYLLNGAPIVIKGQSLKVVRAAMIQE